MRHGSLGVTVAEFVPGRHQELIKLVLSGFMDKLLRANGGCLGIGRRRRTWQAAISLGERLTRVDPGISEWGNPAGVIPRHLHLNT